MSSLSRDRLARPIDISTLIPNAARAVGLMVDEPGLSRGLGEAGSSEAEEQDTPVARGMSGGRTPIGRANARIRALRRARGRGVWIARSGLRSWYPRTPLRDVTAVVRAIERRRARNSDESEGTSAQNQNAERRSVLHIFDENAPPSAQFEPESTTKTPMPTLAKKPLQTPSNRAWSIVASIACEKRDAFMTPEKKLLGSIEKVREVLLEDERRMKNTPAAKKAEREKKIRTLMSMR